MNLETFVLQIKTREGVVFNDDVLSLTSYTQKGKFDILPHHTNFISLIEKELIVRLKNGEERSYDLFAGLLQFLDNKANVFLGFKT